MPLTIIKENYPLIARVYIGGYYTLIYDNEVLIGMDSSALIKLLHRETKGKINTLPVITFHTWLGRYDYITSSSVKMYTFRLK